MKFYDNLDFREIKSGETSMELNVAFNKIKMNIKVMLLWSSTPLTSIKMCFRICLIFALFSQWCNTPRLGSHKKQPGSNGTSPANQSWLNDQSPDRFVMMTERVRMTSTGSVTITECWERGLWVSGGDWLGSLVIRAEGGEWRSCWGASSLPW